MRIRVEVVDDVGDGIADAEFGEDDRDIKGFDGETTQSIC